MAVRKLTAEEKAARLADMKEVRIYTLAEVEAALGIGHRTLQLYVSTGCIKGVKIGGRWKISHDELQRILREGVKTPKTRKKAAEKRKSKAEAP